MQLIEMADRLAVRRYPSDTPVPAWLASASFYSVTRTPDEVSVVCDARLGGADGAKVEVDWRAFRVAGKLDFTLTGILASIAVPLAEAGVSIFAVSTFDTDYVLVKEAQWSLARKTLAAAGFELV